MNNNKENIYLFKGYLDSYNPFFRSNTIFGFILLVFFFCFVSSLKVSGQGWTKIDSIKYYEGQEFAIIGKFHNEKNYARFPQSYESTLRKDVWDLGQNSAGISIRFSSNASNILVRWTVTGNENLDHMASTGVKGVDLYAYIDGRWKYTNTGRVKGKINEAVLVKNAGVTFREYLLNLPLYDGVESLSIGIDSGAKISLPKENYLIAKKPVVYYGSSITQGACASRPGMAFTNILSRAMDRSFINMGFSGNGTFDLPVGEAMCETDAALYVIDCNPNTSKALIYERAIELVKLLKKKRPEVPVLLVEGYYYESGFVKPQDSETKKKNKELRRAYKFLKETRIRQLYYQQGEGLIGNDHEGTADGVHPNDLGMMRMVESLKPTIQKIIKLEEYVWLHNQLNYKIKTERNKKWK